MPMPPVTILEDFMLLALDEIEGAFAPLPRSAFDYATAAATLMDLMQLRRVDCDLRRLYVVNKDPIGDDILDPVLQALVVDPVRTTRSIEDELRFLSEEGDALRDRAMRRLEERGIVKIESEKLLWVFGSRRHLLLEGRAVRDVKRRAVGAVVNDAIPDSRDIALVSLAKATGIYRWLLDASEIVQYQPRIEQIARLDILGTAVAGLIEDIEASIAMASGLR